MARSLGARVLWGGLLFVAGWWAAHASGVPAAVVADEGESLTASTNGDLNGDGMVDVADAIRLLDWLFQGGPEPARINLTPATGQTACYDSLTELDSCDSDTFPGQDGFYQIGCGDRFVDNGDGTITDNCLGLMWQKDVPDPGVEYGADDSGRVNWGSALSYCEELSLAGCDDWRLPNARELAALVDYSISTLGEPALDTELFPEPEIPLGGEGRYWSSTTRSFQPVLAWSVNFGGGDDGSGGDNAPSGEVNSTSKFDAHWVRAVRSL